MNVPTTGSPGRTLTRLDPSGRVEVDGLVFQAETSLFGAAPRRAPIPADRMIVVSGWRADNEHDVVLLVSDPTASTLEPEAAAVGAEPQASPSPLEARIETLERQLQSIVRTVGQSRSVYYSAPAPRVEEAGQIGRLLLTFGQIVSVLGCMAAPIAALDALSQKAAIWIIAGAVLWFLYSAAMFEVFTRCKRSPAK